MRIVWVRAASCVGMVAMLTSCATPMPKYPWRGVEQAKAIILKRAESVRSLQSQGTVRLQLSHDAPVTLDAALLVELPHHARLRAWKFSRPVMDVTCGEDGVWLWLADWQRGQSGSRFPHESIPWQYLQPKWWLGASWLNDEALIPDETDVRLLWLRRDVDAHTFAVGIERDTLTVRIYSWVDCNENIRGTIRLSRYRLAEGVPVPTRVRFEGASGTMAIRLDTISINQRFSSQVFMPPADAKRIVH